MTYDDMWYNSPITHYNLYIVHVMSFIKEKFHQDVIESYITKQITKQVFRDDRARQCSHVLRFFLQEDFIPSIYIGISQLEHILRILAEKHEILTSTIKNRKNNKWPKITEDRMLSMERILEALQEPNALKHAKEVFLTPQYLFSEGGLNFRNKIAHGLIDDLHFENNIPLAYILDYQLLYKSF